MEQSLHVEVERAAEPSESGRISFENQSPSSVGLLGSDKENKSDSMHPQSGQSGSEQKEKRMDSQDTRNILKMINSSDNVLATERNQQIKDLEFLMKNKSEIFNITPPNAKDEDKLKKGAGKYQLINKCINPEWRGFKSSHIMSDK